MSSDHEKSARTADRPPAALDTPVCALSYSAFKALSSVHTGDYIVADSATIVASVDMV